MPDQVRHDVGKVSAFGNAHHVTGVAAMFTAYLVCTSWLVGKRNVQESKAVLEGFALAAAVLGVYSLNLWFDFLADPKALITTRT